MSSVIDVSFWQGSIDWAKVKASGVQLGICKATEGVGYSDPKCIANMAGMASVGLQRGAYHFARPDAGNDPTAEADWFLSQLPQPLPERLALDYEVVGGGAAWCLAWLSRVEIKTSVLPEFYSNYSGVSRVQDARMAGYPLWLAYPGNPASPPVCPAPWKQIALWQYGVGAVPGIGGNVDQDIPLGIPFTTGEPDMTREQMAAIVAIGLAWSEGYTPTPAEINTWLDVWVYQPGTETLRPGASLSFVIFKLMPVSDTHNVPAWLQKLQGAQPAPTPPPAVDDDSQFATKADVAHHTHLNDGADAASAKTGPAILA